MVSSTYTSFNARDRSYLAILKKDIHRLAQQGEFDIKRLAEIDLIVSEMGSNLIKHATQGEILAAVVENEDSVSLDLISLDHGPGIPDLEKMMKDGVSTTKTLGHGLGSMRRLSDLFEVYSRKDWGTIMLSRIYLKKSKPARSHRSHLQFGSLLVAKPGEMVCGDGAFRKVEKNGRVSLLVADGLGHGVEAHKAVTEAGEAFQAFSGESPAEILRHLHQATKKTRGMVATVAIADPDAKTWRICGVGNISTRLIGHQQSKSYLPYNGIVGHNIPGTLNDQELSQNDYQQIILCSDGIKSRWEHARLPAVNKYDLAMQAAVLYKDFGRKTDDMSVIIGRVLP